MNRRFDDTITFKWVDGISAVDPEIWNTLALPLQTPLLEWEWLNLLEISGSLKPEVGWLPLHLTVWRKDCLVAAAPLYVKGHSAGEFVFDHVWADVAERLGIRYYPKLVGMSPFSPVIGYRFLMDPSEDEEKLTASMLEEIDRFCERNRMSGCSFLFVDPAWTPLLTHQGYIGWEHQRFVWKNNGFRTFDDYLAVFNSNQRRNIKRERRTMQDLGIELKTFSADEIPDSFFSLMYRLYENTNRQFGPWGCKYLTPQFFEQLPDHYRHRLLMVAAFDRQRPDPPVGMSFLLHKYRTLYGRYWGSRRELPHLHFNVCYYGPIEWAIANGIHFFDPGMGSSHKVRRGFESGFSTSLHRFYDPRLHKLLMMHIDDINRHEKNQVDALNRALPFAADASHRVKSQARRNQ